MDAHSWFPCRVVPFDGSSAGRLVGPVPAQCTEAAWSPDGRWMYFSANAGGGFHIWRQRFPDGRPEQVTFGVTEEEGIELAPDGRWFVTSIGTRQSTIWVRDAKGERQITAEGYGMLPAFSPDGGKLYYLIREGGARSYISGGLWVTDLATGERRRLLPEFLIQTYGLSPDGSKVVFVAANDSARAPVWLASLDGRSPPRRVLPDGARPQRVFFGSPGELIVAIQRANEGFVVRLPEQGGEPQSIPVASPYVEGVSPDGRWVAAWSGEMLLDLLAYSVDGGAPRVLCRNCAPAPSFERGPWPPPVSWAPDRAYIYLDLFGFPYAIPLPPGQALPSLPAEGLRSEEEVAALAGARRIPHEYAFPGPDPSRYAFTRVTIQRNIYRVPVP
jgi:hypothetical protein